MEAHHGHGQAPTQQMMMHNFFIRRPIVKSKSPAVKWVKEWVPQDVVATGGKCYVLKWITEAALKALKENGNEEVPVPEPEPTTEVLFLCSYEGCGKTFIDAGALKKHSHIHGERQYVCHYDGCKKKFLDSSKLKRHFLIHTGERDYVCPHEGCGKAFSLDFNLRSHMKTHSHENYHLCPYQDCGKRYAHEFKLKNHIASQHEKNSGDVIKYTPTVVEKPVKTPKSTSGTNSSMTPGLHRPYACPYEGCHKAYKHEYKLNLHFKNRHPGHFDEDNNAAKSMQPKNNVDNVDETSDHDIYAVKRSNSKSLKQSRPKPNLKLPPSKIQRKSPVPGASSASLNMVKKPWPVKEEDEDSEETEEDRDDGEDGWRYGENNDEDDDEETEDED